MKQKQRITGLLFLTALLLAACGDTTKPVETAVSGETAVQTAAVETENLHADDLPVLDFGGDKVRVVEWNMEDIVGEFKAEQENGEVINDAVFRRNRSVEERLNVSMDLSLIDSDSMVEVTNTVVRSVTAGDDEFDLMAETSV